MIVHMCKLRIVALDEQFETLITTLQRLGYLHLEPVPLNLPKREDTLHRMQLTVEDERRRQVLAEARSHLEELHTLLGDFPRSTPADRDVWEKQSPEAIRDAAGELLRCVALAAAETTQPGAGSAHSSALRAGGRSHAPAGPSREFDPSADVRLPQRRANDWPNAA